MTLEAEVCGACGEEIAFGSGLCEDCRDDRDSLDLEDQLETILRDQEAERGR